MKIVAHIVIPATTMHGLREKNLRRCGRFLPLLAVTTRESGGDDCDMFHEG